MHNKTVVQVSTVRLGLHTHISTISASNYEAYSLTLKWAIHFIQELAQGSMSRKGNRWDNAPTESFEGGQVVRHAV